MYFNFKTNDREELIYKRVSCDLVNAIRDLKKELQKACIAIEEKNVAAQADKFRCCGVCANYRYEVAAKGRCKWPSYKASQMRTACKRFERVNEKTELYNDYSAKGVNIK